MPYRNPVKSQFFREEGDEESRYFLKETPVGNYVFRFRQDWDGNEKPIGELTLDGDLYLLSDVTLEKAEDFARDHIKKKLEEKKEEEAVEEKVETLEEQLLRFAREFRESDRFEAGLAKYRLLLQQAQQLGLIPDDLRKKINRINKSIGKLDSRASDDLEKMAQVIELIAKEAKNFQLKTAFSKPSSSRVASLWNLRKKAE